jgi:DCN1-like protein 1/2
VGVESWLLDTWGTITKACIWKDDQQTADTIGMEGTQRYCQDIAVSVEDLSFLILSELVRSENMGEIKREGFVDGWSAAG